MDERQVIEVVKWVEGFMRDATNHIERWEDRGSFEELRLAGNACYDASQELYNLNADLLNEIAQERYEREYMDLSLSQQGIIQEERDIFLAERAKEEQEGRL